MSALAIVTAVWVVVTLVYLLLFMYPSVLGMKEDDNIYLRADEAKLEAEQEKVMMGLNKLEAALQKLGWVVLALTILVAGMWGYDMLGQL